MKWFYTFSEKIRVSSETVTLMVNLKTVHKTPVQINYQHPLSFGTNYRYQYMDSDVYYDFSDPFVIELQDIRIDDASALYAGIDY